MHTHNYLFIPTCAIVVNPSIAEVIGKDIKSDSTPPSTGPRYWLKQTSIIIMKHPKISFKIGLTSIPTSPPLNSLLVATYVYLVVITLAFMLDY